MLGYLLKPVEKMFSLEGAEARMEAALCWKTLVLQVIVVEVMCCTHPDSAKPLS